MATVKYLNVIYVFFISLLYIKTIYASIKVFKDDTFIAELSDKQSIYGDVFFDPLNGLIVPAEPFDACSLIQVAPQYANFSSFVLISDNDSYSSGCITPYKIREAAFAGFDLAIIINTDSLEKQKKRNEIEQKMHVVTSDKTISHKSSTKGKVEYRMVIPTIIVDAGTGAIILERYIFRNESSNVYWLRVSSDGRDFKLYIMLFGIIIAICFIIMLMFMVCLLIKCIRERRRLRRNRLSTRQIRQLGTIIYTNDNQYKTCAICLEDYEEGERLRLLPCQHMFHIKCIDPWLHDNRRTCPLCKRKIRTRQSGDDSSSNSDSDDASRSSSVTENARLIPSRESVRNSARMQAIADAIINMINQPSESETSDIENNTSNHNLPNYSEEADLLGNAEQPATIGSVNHSESEVFVDALAPGESHQSGIHV